MVLHAALSDCGVIAIGLMTAPILATTSPADRSTASLHASGVPSFTAVQVAPDAAPPAADVALAAGTAERVEVTLTNGRRLSIGLSIDESALVRLVQVLERA